MIYTLQMHALHCRSKTQLEDFNTDPGMILMPINTTRAGEITPTLDGEIKSSNNLNLNNKGHLASLFLGRKRPSPTLQIN